MLNPTARILLNCLDRPSTLAELVAMMSRLTEAPEATLEGDLGEVLPELERLGAVRRVPAE